MDVPFKRHVHWLSVQTQITLLKGVMVKAVQHNVNKVPLPLKSDVLQKSNERSWV